MATAAPDATAAVQPMERTHTPPTPEQRPYAPQGACREVMTHREQEVLIEGPARTGKTRAILEKAFTAANRYPGCRILFLRKVKATMAQTVLQTFEEHVVPEQHPILRGPQRNCRTTYRFGNSSEIVVGGLDEAGKIMSSEYDIICMFEATDFAESDLEMVESRLSNGKMPYRQVLLDCNPSAPWHWLNKRADTGMMVRIRSRLTDNPRFYCDGEWTPDGLAYQQILESLTGVRRSRLKDGIWAAAEGLVYDEWDPAIHVVPKLPAGHEGWRRMRSIDFGYTNPFVCAWYAIDPDGRMYRYREIYYRQRTVREHAAHINQLSGMDPCGGEYEITVADHDAEDRATLEEAGIYTEPAHKAVSPGIEAVKLRLRPAGDGKPRLFFVEDALVEVDQGLRESGRPYMGQQEFEGYVWTAAKDGKPVKEAPVKVDDHALDEVRYAVAHVDRLDGTGEAWVG